MNFNHESEPVLSVNRLAGEDQRRRSFVQIRPTSRRRVRRSQSSSMLSEQQQQRRGGDQSTEFIFQQPAFDPDVFKPQYKMQSATPKRGWNLQMAIYVKRMGQRAGGYKWMHGQAGRYFNRRFQWIGITAIVVNALATAGNIPYVASCQDDLNWIKIIAIILGFLVTITMAFQQFKDYGGRTNQHATGEANYAALYDHIQQQLRKNSRDRQDANDYVEWISKELNDLKAASPMIPPGILGQYRKIIEGKNIADPEGIDEIIIKRDSPERENDDDVGDTVAPSNTELVEIIVDQQRTPPPPRLGKGQEVPRSGRLVVTYNDDAKPITARDRIELDRWNSQ